MKHIYLDNNATTGVDEAVLEAMLPYFSTEYGNPSSIHSFGINAKNSLEEARKQVAIFLGAKHANEIIFTSGGTESANLAIRGCLKAQKNKKHIITTKVEHACVLNTFRELGKEGYSVTYLGVNSGGELDLEELCPAPV